VTGRVVVAGVSTRAAAESAAKAGFDVIALDAFGDIDQHPAVRSVTLPRRGDLPFSAYDAAQAVRDVAADAAAYLSPFENHPGAVDELGSGRTLWGNPPEVLRRVRDPFVVAGSLRRRGFAAPITRVDVTSEAGAWLIKPFRSGGGHGVRLWETGTRVARGFYVQERIDGVPASIVFVAANGRAVPLGISRQLAGDPAFGASGYRYCGSILASAADDVLTDAVSDRMTALACEAAAQFGLIGLNGIDCVIRDGTPYAIEINPRWCSSMELVERHYGMSLFAAHAAACAEGVLPVFDLRRARRTAPVAGKAVVFAWSDVVAGDTRSWLGDDSVRDVPKPHERFAAGQPICTVFAQGNDYEACASALAARAQAIRGHFQGLDQRGSRSAS